MSAPGKNITRRDFLGVIAGSAITISLNGCRAFRRDPSRAGAPSFGIVADAQYSDRDARGSRHYRASLGKLAASVEDFNGQDLDFVIHLGDFIDEDFASFDALLPIYDELTMPHYHVLGNHDFAVSDDKKSAVRSKLGMPGRYYDFGLDGFRFIVLDGNDVSLYGNPEGSRKEALAAELLQELTDKKKPNAQSWNGAVGTEQIAWLESTLEGARSAREKAILFCHFPVYPENVHNLWNDREVIDIIEASGQVVAYINGHNHHGDYAVKKGVHYVTVQGMVETPDRTAYATVLSKEGSLEIDGRDREPDRLLPCADNG